MATYAIGDIQGCYAVLQRLLERIQFDPANDQLWLAGDLVNRGPESLAVLRFVKKYSHSILTVLGNHDLHLLGAAYEIRSLSPLDTLSDILNASDRDELLFWLRQQPLVHYDAGFNALLVHAGILPNWSIQKTLSLAEEVTALLKKNPLEVLKSLFSRTSGDYWQEELKGAERWRTIVNCLTRMRFCTADGHLDFTYKGTIQNKPKHLIPWFDAPREHDTNTSILFGHWAALNGKTNHLTIHALDTGCVWGNGLTAFCLETQERFFEPA